MVNIIPNKSPVRGWCIQTKFVHITNFGRISEPTFDTNELGNIARIKIDI